MGHKIGTKEKPMVLKTPPLTSEYTMHVEQKDGKDVMVCTVGKTVLLYNMDCIDDLHKMLKKHGDWMELGSADEQKPAKDGTVEAWGRSGIRKILKLIMWYHRRSTYFKYQHDYFPNAIG